jgi:hypothetical protein
MGIGGGGGGYARNVFAVTAGSDYTITIGVGGMSHGDALGTPGGTTTFGKSGAVPLLVAWGGSAATAPNSDAPGGSGRAGAGGTVRQGGLGDAAYGYTDGGAYGGVPPTGSVQPAGAHGGNASTVSNGTPGELILEY